MARQPPALYAECEHCHHIPSVTSSLALLAYCDKTKDRFNELLLFFASLDRTLLRLTKRMPVNHQLWQERPGEHGTIKAAQAATEVSGRQVLVRVHSWAINPCDALLQDRALPFIKYPVILGQDIVSQISKVGHLIAVDASYDLTGWRRCASGKFSSGKIQDGRSSVWLHNQQCLSRVCHRRPPLGRQDTPRRYL